MRLFSAVFGTRMRGLALALPVVAAVTPAASLWANPSYRWTGGAGTAASGDYAGTYLWSDAGNWERVSDGSNEVPAAGASGSTNATVLDFTDLEANATITFDLSSTQYFLGSMTFGANKGTQTLAMGAAATGYVTSIENGATFTVPSGTTVDFRLKKPQNANGSGATHTFTGGGVFRVSSATFSAYRARCAIAANTTLELNSATADFRSAYIAFLAATSRFVLNADAKIGAIVGSSEAAPGQIELNGHTLEYGMSYGTFVTSTAHDSWLKSAKCKVWTDAVGTGKLVYSGAAVYTNMVSQSVGGSLKLMNADVVMADGASFTGSPALEIGGSGMLTLGSSQAVATFAGDGTTGGVEIPSGATLTVTGSASGTTNYNATLSGAGAFAKNGNDELVLIGKNTMTGPTTVGGGVLVAKGSAAVVAAETSLNHGYSFEDSMADNRATGGKTAKFSYRVDGDDSDDPPAGATASSFCEGRRGTRGVEMHSGSFASVYTFQAADTGTGPFTVTFWMVPATNICLSSNSQGATYLAFVGNGGGAAYNVARIYLVNGTNLNFSAGKTTNKSVVNEDGLGVATDIPWGRLYDGNWHMVTMTYSGDGEDAGAKTLSGYFDGELVGSKLLDGGTLTVTGNGRLHLGWGSKGSIAGRFDDWKYLSRCQTAAEVKAEFLGEVEEGDDYAALPAPVAKWTFDDEANPGKDTSGNGYDLSSVDGFSASVVGADGAYGKSLAPESVLGLAPGGSFPAKIPTGNSPWTLSLRYQAGAIYDANNYNNQSVFYWGNPTNLVGSNYSDLDRQFFSAVMYNTDNYHGCYAGAKYNGARYHDPSGTMKDISYSDIVGRFAWTHIVYVFVPGDGIYAYQDGRFSARWGVYSFSIAAQDVVVGLRPKYGGYYVLAPFRGYIDDIRMWDSAFTADQVRTLVRGMADGASPSPLSAGSDITVASGATLKVEGTGVSAKSVSGAGTLEVAEASSLTVGGGALSGELRGLGQVNVTAPFKVASASNYFGNVVLSGSGSVDAPGISLPLALPDPYSATVASAAALPLARTSGRLVLPDALCIAFASEPESGTYLFAEAGDLALPADIGAWRVSAGKAKAGRFLVRNGKVYLKVFGPGLKVLFM